jgi:hypothetical protein
MGPTLMIVTTTDEIPTLSKACSFSSKQLLISCWRKEAVLLMFSRFHPEQFHSVTLEAAALHLHPLA